VRDETAAWLGPMLEAADQRDIHVPIERATMPAAETDSPAVQWIAGYMPPGARVSGIDWIRFGQLLRDELGWADYPDEPEWDAP
jgi:hypothetical protein